MSPSDKIGLIIAGTCALCLVPIYWKQIKAFLRRLVCAVLGCGISMWR